MALRLPAIMRTTAARLSALYFILFALCAVLLVFYMTSLSASMLTAQTMETINEEVQGLDSAYRRGGLPFLVRVVEQRSRQPGANLYLIADANGRILTGNVESLEPGVLETDGWTEVPFTYQRYGEGIVERRAPSVSELETPPAATETRHAAIALISRLPNQMIVLVGRDLGEPERFRIVVQRALIFALSIMAVGGLLIWYFVGRRALKRIDSISDAGKRIMGGDLRAAAGDRRRRRIRPPVGKPQHHADQDRRAERGAEAGLRQHRARPEDAADQAAQPGRSSAGGQSGSRRLPRGAGGDDRRIRPSDKDLQRDPDDLAAGGGLFRRTADQGRPRGGHP